MSVVSENSYQRISHKSLRTARSFPRGRIGSSDGNVPFLVPNFSAASSEGVKLKVDDDNWAESTTVVTGNTSEHSYNGAAERVFVAPVGRVVARRCSRLFWLCSATAISFISIVSSPLMAALPFLLNYFGYGWTEIKCVADCQGFLLNMATKTLLLIAALWAIYFRHAPADLPRLNFHRASLSFFALFILFAFWLFYVVRILIEKQRDYVVAVSFSLSLLDALLYYHYISVIVLELRSLRSEFVVTVVRDPDGESQIFNLGLMSIQEAAVFILKNYTTKFPSYNPFLDRSGGGGAPKFRSGSSQVSAGFKMYDIEGLGAQCTISEANARVLMEAAAKRHIGGHNERYCEIMEWERRLQKRKYRLISTTEDAFSSVQSVTSSGHHVKTLGEPMEALGAAQAVFSAIARPLNKYLRLTRQQPRHNADQVVAHLARCLSLRFSAATFLQRFFSPRYPFLERVEEAKWSIVCNIQASAPVQHGTIFVLRCHQRDEDAGVQLLCSVHSLPFFNLTEQQTTTSKFALKITSESTGR